MNELRVILNKMLPPGTIVCSPDMYDHFVKQFPQKIETVDKSESQVLGNPQPKGTE